MYSLQYHLLKNTQIEISICYLCYYNILKVYLIVSYQYDSKIVKHLECTMDLETIVF